MSTLHDIKKRNEKSNASSVDDLERALKEALSQGTVRSRKTQKRATSRRTGKNTTKRKVKYV